MTLKELNKAISHSQTIVAPFNICYFGIDAFLKLDKEIDKYMVNHTYRREQMNLIVPAFEWRGLFCMVSDCLPANVSMIGIIEESELKRLKDVAGWPL